MMLMPLPLTVGAVLEFLAPIAEITSSLDVVGVMLPGEIDVPDPMALLLDGSSGDGSFDPLKHATAAPV
jgi:hypothetical protein